MNWLFLTEGFFSETSVTFDSGFFFIMAELGGVQIDENHSFVLYLYLDGSGERRGFSFGNCCQSFSK